MKIAVIEDEKPHRDLLVHYLKQWKGKYRELWDAQAQYYQ